MFVSLFTVKVWMEIVGNCGKKKLLLQHEKKGKNESSVEPVRIILGEFPVVLFVCHILRDSSRDGPLLVKS
jgi:hypothetical protein